MKFSILQKLGGIALIKGAVLLTVYAIAFMTLLPAAEARHDITLLVQSPYWIWIALVAFGGVLSMIFGFIAVYSKIYAESGITGLIGIIFIVFAYILQACKVTWEIFLYPIICASQAYAPLLKDFIIQHNTGVVIFRYAATLSIFLGILFFCAALIRSAAFPKIAGILIFTGAVIYGIGPMISVFIAIGGIIVLSIGCSMVGVKMINTQAS
jgi:hypothetical protein